MMIRCRRLNTEGRGKLLGDFAGADRIVTVIQSGAYKVTSFDLSTHFEEDMILIEKYEPAVTYTAIYQEQDTKQYYIKRFKIDPSEKKVEFVDPGCKMVLFTMEEYPNIEVLFDMKQKSKGSESEIVKVNEFIGVKGVKAKGRRVTIYPVKKLEWLEPLQIEESLPVDVIAASEDQEQTEPEILLKPKRQIRARPAPEPSGSPERNPPPNPS